MGATKAGDEVEIGEAGEGDVEGLARGHRLPIGGEVDGQIFPGPRLALAGSSVAGECGRMAPIGRATPAGHGAETSPFPLGF